MSSLSARGSFKVMEVPFGWPWLQIGGAVAMLGLIALSNAHQRASSPIAPALSATPVSGLGRWC